MTTSNLPSVFLHCRFSTYHFSNTVYFLVFLTFESPPPPVIILEEHTAFIFRVVVPGSFRCRSNWENGMCQLGKFEEIEASQKCGRGKKG